jgi:GTP-binding protein HflX
LFNALTQASAYAADQLFATLDTTSRRVYLEDGVHAVISDTVGFIRGLPHTLVAAFRATLEETVRADLLVHVVDASHPNRDEQAADVNKVLVEIGAGAIPQVVVYNKTDLLAVQPAVINDECGNICALWVSAKQRVGLERLREALQQHHSQQSNMSVAHGAARQFISANHVAERSAMG